MAKYNIAITGLNAADSPCAGISVARSLKDGLGDDVRIIGLAYELLCGASYDDKLIDEVYSVPFPQDDEDKYLSRISEITEKTKIDVFIPNLDFEIPFLSRLEAEFRDIGLKLLIPPDSALTLCKKENMAKLAQLVAVDYPASIVFNDQRQVSHTAAYFTYPLVVKAATGEAYIVYSLEEAIVFSKRLAVTWGWPLIMQQYIKGDEYCVASLSDRRQNVFGSVCMKKILKSKSGTAWMGVTTKNDKLISLTTKIIDKLKWVGPIEVEFIKEQSTGKHFFVEINTRFPAWIQLAAKAGCNLPIAAAKIALRHKVEPVNVYKKGILFARSGMDITCGITRLGQLATKKELVYHENG